MKHLVYHLSRQIWSLVLLCTTCLPVRWADSFGSTRGEEQRCRTETITWNVIIHRHIAQMGICLFICIARDFVKSQRSNLRQFVTPLTTISHITCGSFKQRLMIKTQGDKAVLFVERGHMLGFCELMQQIAPARTRGWGGHSWRAEFGPQSARDIRWRMSRMTGGQILHSPLIFSKISN